MTRIDHILFGYVLAKVEIDDIATAVSALLREGLSAGINRNGELRIPLFEFKKFQKALSCTNVKYSKPRGLVGYIVNNRCRFGAILGVIVMLLVSAFSLNRVWDIRVDTEGDITDAEICDVLVAAGFGIGSSWSEIDKSATESRVLSLSDDIGWININRRGCIAYVSVKEKRTAYEDDFEVYSNVVAEVDCVISEITVYSGVAVVKAGDTVRAGELLISGVIPAELGGGFTAAEGVVLGRILSSIEVEVDKNESVKQMNEEELSEVTLNIFGNSINIFKKYRNSDDKYDIIKSTEHMTLFGKYRLPIEIHKIYRVSYREQTAEYTSGELINIASSRLNMLKESLLRSASLLKISTVGEFTENGYRMKADAVIERDIGLVRKIISENVN